MFNSSYYLYKSVAKLVTTLLGSETTSIWYRNSLIFKNISFIRSDIDFTIFEKLSGANFNPETIKKYQQLKKLIPIIGELNYYNDSTIKLMKFHNFYEIQRDPILLKRVDYRCLRGLEAQKKVFISRMFLSNIHRIQKGLFQKKKWSSYFGLIEEKAPESIKDILEYLQISTPSEINQKIEYVPVDYLAGALEINDLTGFITTASDLNNTKLEILKENLYWELPGVIAQLHNSKLENIENHFRNIMVVLKQLGEDTAEIESCLLGIGIKI